MNDPAARVKPDLPSGYHDYSPEQMLAREQILAAITRVYRRFGFVPLQTSVGQRRQVLTGGAASENRLWNMRVDKDAVMMDEATTVTARFDLTVPLARYVAEHIGMIRFPFRRYESGEVFRGETPGAGRFCEFGQFDVDIVGAETGPADAEIILCMAAVMGELKIERYLIRVNNRKVLNGFAEKVGLASGSPAAAALMRIMDKADKIGLEGVLAELRAKTAPEGEEYAFEFDEARIEMVRVFMRLTEGLETNAERLQTLAAYFNEEGSGAEGVRELAQIATLLEAGGMPEENWTIDPSVARGLGYYTGPVFETHLLDWGTSSVYSGGRYDDLVARFTGERLPCVGASVGVDRLFAALEALGKIDGKQAEVDVYIMTMDATLMARYFSFAADLRRAGISVEVNMGHQDTSMRGQITTSLVRKAPILLFFGKDDAEAGTIGIKVTETRKQENVPLGNLVSHVLTALKRTA